MRTFGLLLFCLLHSVAVQAQTELVVNRLSMDNTVSIQTQIFGPVQVQLKDSKTSALLYSSVLNGPGTFQARDLPAQSLNNLVLTSVPGSPSVANPFTYQIPFSANAQWSISQGFHGQTSHYDALNAYAVDFDIPLGTPVIAARSGIVMEVVDQYPDTGGTRKSDIELANIIRILHEDGTMAIYGHLMQNSAVVAPGLWLVGGSVIAQSGNSGFTRGPHLHFAVQLNSGMELNSIPFQMRSVNGLLNFDP
jgi:murein DD-endopeptidase MepM/ murein hydrolase activator NlpD